LAKPHCEASLHLDCCPVRVDDDSHVLDTDDTLHQNAAGSPVHIHFPDGSTVRPRIFRTGHADSTATTAASFSLIGGLLLTYEPKENHAASSASTLGL